MSKNFYADFAAWAEGKAKALHDAGDYLTLLRFTYGLVGLVKVYIRGLSFFDLTDPLKRLREAIRKFRAAWKGD
jgi:hypothetical protein